MNGITKAGAVCALAMASLVPATPAHAAGDVQAGWTTCNQFLQHYIAVGGSVSAEPGYRAQWMYYQYWILDRTTGEWSYVPNHSGTPGVMKLVYQDTVEDGNRNSVGTNSFSDGVDTVYVTGDHSYEVVLSVWWWRGSAWSDRMDYWEGAGGWGFDQQDRTGRAFRSDTCVA